MCQSIAYALAAATGTREEADRPAEWKAEEEDGRPPEEARKEAPTVVS